MYIYICKGGTTDGPSTAKRPSSAKSRPGSAGSRGTTFEGTSVTGMFIHVYVYNFETLKKNVNVKCAKNLYILGQICVKFIQ
jgi:hypothetical protein